jgi:hypothetical protein
MPQFLVLFANWFKGLFAGVLGFFGLELTKKVAILTAALAFMATITLALWTAIETTIDSFYVSIPSEILAPITWLVPGNLPAAFAAAVSMRILRALYDYKIKATSLRVQGT